MVPPLQVPAGTCGLPRILRGPGARSRSGGARELWVADAVSPNGKWIHQRIELARAAPVGRVAIVVDGSRGMADHAAAIADALAAIPSDRAVDLIVASDEVVVLHEGDQPGGRSAALDALRSFRFEGGQDNVPALVAAWERASRARASAILWIHDPQPILFEPVEGLLQRYERRRGAPPLVSLATSPGPDRVLEALPAWVPVEVAPRLGAAGDDLRREVAAWTDGAPRWTAVRERSVSDGRPGRDEPAVDGFGASEPPVGERRGEADPPRASPRCGGRGRGRRCAVSTGDRGERRRRPGDRRAVRRLGPRDAAGPRRGGSWAASRSRAEHGRARGARAADPGRRARAPPRRGFDPGLTRARRGAVPLGLSRVRSG